MYERTEREFEEVSSTLKSIVNKALSLMASQVDTRGEGESIILFNALSWDRGGIVELEVDKEYDVKDERGNIVPSQMIEEGGRRKLLFLVDKVPSIGYRVLRLTPRTSKLSPGVEVKEDENTIVLENEFLRINIDKRTGLVRSIFDKINGKEVLKGQGLRIEVFKDEPREGRITLDVERPFDAVTMDAWEIYIFQRIEGVEVEPLTKPDEVKVVERGPLRAVVDVKYTYKQEGRPDTKITHRLILYRALPYLIGEVEMDCHTVHRLFKLSMDLNMYSEYVAYEIPYGAILRRNPGSPYASLYERAKWEVPAHKWLDYYDSEEHYGVALINDSKYGFDVMTHTVRMTLLRTPRYPPRWGEPWIPGAGEPMEQGMHKTRYAIYPHKGDWKEAKVYKIAYEFNYPILVRVESAHEGKLPSSMSFINIEPDHVILSAVKRAEDSEDIIIRVYEVEGKDADVKISLPKEVTGAIEVDLLERPIETSEAKVEVKGREVVFRVGHNEIKTLKLSLS
ncbi:MAG: hypothetical protein DRM97_08205 [Thermoprotei archaeon]|nr:MAG: hypothetical protein DRM97_08205 [Thermoprotei archaeon]